MTADADPDAGTGQAGEHARGGLSELLGLLDLEGIDGQHLQRGTLIATVAQEGIAHTSQPRP